MPDKQQKQIALFFDQDLADAIAKTAIERRMAQTELIREILAKALLPEYAPKPKVGDLAIQYIQQGLDNHEIARRIREEIPGAKTSPSSVSWYRSKVK